MINLPQRVPVKDLCITNEEYKGSLIRLYNHLYQGGNEFINVIDEMLVKRDIERHLPKAYDDRKGRSDYINRAGGLLDYLRAAVFKVEPLIVSDPESGYWQGLNEDADGLRTPLPSLLRDALLSLTLHNRSYLLADFRENIFDPTSVKSADARLRVLKPEVVDDWERDSLGNLLWVRLHTAEMIRSGVTIIDRPNIELHRWVYIDDDSISTYEARIDPRGVPADAVANLVSTEQHQFEVLPVFEVRGSTSTWVLDKLYPVIKSLFNRESAVTFQLDRQSFAQLVLTLQSQERVNDLFVGELAAIVLSSEYSESAGYVTPPATAFAPGFDDVERLTKAMYEVVSSLALNAAATQTQNARQSAEAKKIDRDPLETMLASFAWPVLAALDSWIDAVKAYRREDHISVKILGMDRFELKEDDVKRQLGIEEVKPKVEAEPELDQEVTETE